MLFFLFTSNEKKITRNSVMIINLEQFITLLIYNFK